MEFFLHAPQRAIILHKTVKHSKLVLGLSMHTSLGLFYSYYQECKPRNQHLHCATSVPSLLPKLFFSLLHHKLLESIKNTEPHKLSCGCCPNHVREHFSQLRHSSPPLHFSKISNSCEQQLRFMSVEFAKTFHLFEW